jgi:MinD-like ATPase involved in chromosome partitioning or flagellar assembly
LSDEGTPFVIKEPESKAAEAFAALVDKLTKKVKME